MVNKIQVLCIFFFIHTPLHEGHGRKGVGKRWGREKTEKKDAHVYLVQGYVHVHSI